MSRFADQLPIVTEPTEANFLLGTDENDPKSLVRISPGDFRLVSRQVVLPLGVIGAGITLDATVNLSSIYLITSIASNAEIRCRLYYSDAYRESDASRASIVPITGDHGCYLDVITRAENGLERILAPPVVGVMNDVVYLSVTNRSVTEQEINLTINYLPLED